MDKEFVSNWLEVTFEKDILKESYDDFEKGFLMLIPSMDVKAFERIYKYYTGSMPKSLNFNIGTGLRYYIEFTKFVDSFWECIDTDKTIEDNIRAMIEKAEEKNSSGIPSLYTLYFNLCLDRLRHKNFVDVRMVFHELYAKNIADGIGELERAFRGFEDFINKQPQKKAMLESQGKEYVKEFFTWKLT